jgi:hypothetical protein
MSSTDRDGIKFDTVAIIPVWRKHNHKEVFLGEGDNLEDIDRLAGVINKIQREQFTFQGFAPTKDEEDWQLIFIKPLLVTTNE